MKWPRHKFLDDKYWKLLTRLNSLEGEITFKELLSELGAPYRVHDIMEAIFFLKRFGQPLKVEKVPPKGEVLISGKGPQFAMNLSLCEWLALQTHFPFLEENKGRKIYDTLVGALQRMEEHYPQGDLYHYIREEDEMNKVMSTISHEKEDLLKRVDEALDQGRNLLVEVHGGKVELSIHKVVYIDGVLSLIGEDVNDRCLSCFDINEIESYFLIPRGSSRSYRTNFAGAEVDDFISAIRSITGNEKRLVMKVSSRENVNLSPHFHFLGSPFVTTNSQGDFIWAASVEVSEELYGWLSTIYDNIEILEPVSLREGLEKFMEKKGPLTSLKKVS